MRHPINNFSLHHLCMYLAYTVLCFSLTYPPTVDAATGYKLPGIDMACVPMGAELYTFAQNCYNQGGYGYASQLWRLTSPTTCQRQEFAGANCTGSHSPWQNTTGIGCTDLKNKLANPEPCELPPICDNREEKIEVTISSRPGVDQEFCLEGCRYILDPDDFSPWIFFPNAGTGTASLAIDTQFRNCSPADDLPPHIPEPEPEWPDDPQPETPPPAPSFADADGEMFFNGQKFEPPLTGCELLSGGSMICATGSTPPLGRDGEQQYNEVGMIGYDGSEYTFHNPKPQTGMPGTGAGLGGQSATVPSDGIVGGNDCNTPPSCSSGSRIMCFIAQSTWKTHCALTNGIQKVLGTVDDINFDGISIPTTEKNFESLEISQTGYGNYACPAPTPFEVLGKTFEIKYDQLCQMAILFKTVVVLFAWVTCALMVYAYATRRI